MFASFPDFDAPEENTVATLLQRMPLCFVNLKQTLNVFYTMAAGEKKSFDLKLLFSYQRGVHICRFMLRCIIWLLIFSYIIQIYLNLNFQESFEYEYFYVT